MNTRIRVHAAGMPAINSSQALSILGGSEGAINNSVRLSVRHDILGTIRGTNGSGLSFGKVQSAIGIPKKIALWLNSHPVLFYVPSARVSQ
jgi:hypothetical protein